MDGQCSAVLVAPNAILTAAHCVQGTNPDGSGTGFPKDAYSPNHWVSMTNGPVIDGNAQWWDTQVASAWIHPDWILACQNGCPSAWSQAPSVTAPYAPDLAILVMTTNAPFGVAPVNIDLAALNPGDQVTVAGFGCEVSTSGPKPDPPRLKLGFTSVEDAFHVNDVSSVVADLDAFGNNYSVTPGRNGGGAVSLCPGDSGGPVFRGDVSENLLVGINANYTFDNPTGGVSVTNIHVRTVNAAIADWIASVLFGH
jgi:hypothetical protein